MRFSQTRRKVYGAIAQAHAYHTSKPYLDEGREGEKMEVNEVFKLTLSYLTRVTTSKLIKKTTFFSYPLDYARGWVALILSISAVSLRWQPSVSGSFGRATG